MSDSDQPDQQNKPEGDASEPNEAIEANEADSASPEQVPEKSSSHPDQPSQSDQQDQPDQPDQSDQAAPEAAQTQPAASGPDLHQQQVHEALVRYWRSNILIMAVLLVIWAIVGLGCGVLFADWLNQWTVGGFPLGFWFAQQGSIIVFVLLILVYCILLNRLDAKHHEELEQLRNKGNA